MASRVIRLMLMGVTTISSMSWHVPHLMTQRRPFYAHRARHVAAVDAPRRKTFAEEAEAKAAAKAALDAATAKLEALNEVEKAPTSWADMGL